MANTFKRGRPLWSFARSTGTYKVLGGYLDDRRGLGQLLSRRLRAFQKAALHQEVTVLEVQAAPEHPPAVYEYTERPERLRNCELPRCPACHWVDKGWGTEQEAIASWRNT